MYSSAYPIGIMGPYEPYRPPGTPKPDTWPALFMSKLDGLLAMGGVSKDEVQRLLERQGEFRQTVKGLLALPPSDKLLLKSLLVDPIAEQILNNEEITPNQIPTLPTDVVRLIVRFAIAINTHGPAIYHITQSTGNWEVPLMTLSSCRLVCKRWRSLLRQDNDLLLVPLSISLNDTELNKALRNVTIAGGAVRGLFIHSQTQYPHYDTHNLQWDIPKFKKLIDQAAVVSPKLTKLQLDSVSLDLIEFLLRGGLQPLTNLNVLKIRNDMGAAVGNISQAMRAICLPPSVTQFYISSKYSYDIWRPMDHFSELPPNLTKLCLAIRTNATIHEYLKRQVFLTKLDKLELFLTQPITEYQSSLALAKMTNLASFRLQDGGFFMGANPTSEIAALVVLTSLRALHLGAKKERHLYQPNKSPNVPALRLTDLNLLSHHLTRLHTLSITEHKVEGVAALQLSPIWATSLTSLHLDLTEFDVQNLTDSAHQLSSLRTLHYECPELDKAFRAILPAFPSLRDATFPGIDIFNSHEYMTTLTDLANDFKLYSNQFPLAGFRTRPLVKAMKVMKPPVGAPILPFHYM